MVIQKERIEQARRGTWFGRIKQAIKDFRLTPHDVAVQKRGFYHQMEKDEKDADARKRARIKKRTWGYPSKVGS